MQSSTALAQESISVKGDARSWLPIFSLLALGVAAGVGWRIELENRFGWDGLKWTTGHYWTEPVAVLLFIAWAAWVAPVHNRAGFVGALLIMAFVGSLATRLAADFLFARFGASFFVSLAIWLLIPVSFGALGRLFGAPVTLLKTICSTLLFVLSWPVAIFVRTFFEQRGSSDFIHALKSGFVIPFLVLSLGLPLLAFPAGRSGRGTVVK